MTLKLADRVIPEQTTAIYSATLLDADKQAIPGSALATLTLTVYDVATGDVINDRDEQNVLNTNGVTVNESGVLTCTLDPLDNVITGSDQTAITDGAIIQELHTLRGNNIRASIDYEAHGVMFRYTDVNGNAGEHEVVVYVKNLRKVS